MASSSVLLVTSYYPLADAFHTRGEKDWENRLEHFLRIARLGIDVLVFTDEAHGHLLQTRIEAESLPRVDVNSILFPDFWSTVTANTLVRKHWDLPPCRHPEKDSVEYMVLQLCKTEFVAAALHMERYQSKTILAWFDFSLGRLLYPDGLESRLWNRLSTNLPGRITIPGCWDAPRVTDMDLFRTVCWRFCGGFFCGDREAISYFFEAVLRSLPLFVDASDGVLAWEVNVWAWIEKHCETLFQWYPGDHNDSIL